MNLPAKGICPHCESSVGEIFTPCPEKGCSKNGYHLIGKDSYTNYGICLMGLTNEKSGLLGCKIHKICYGFNDN